ncbi:dipeptidase [Chloroflexus aggregans]|uniref:Membrane dipeptidase n=1 Tax=Chloroflexus aggregans (strain MD-66 / DSM 9485) TaxID=326427 RepID=B8GC05_CHLAD|nr:dipeptidase [Chloroflexus aggregans]ACL22979.1 Membrane dipeptidase [Chloroflexus aggregans DSM 9485]
MTTAAWPLIFDGHNDVILELYRPQPGKERDFFHPSPHGHLDLPRARVGGFGGGFFAVYVPPPTSSPTVDRLPEPPYHLPLPPALDPTYALRTTLAMAARLFRIEAESQGALRVCRTAGDIADCLANNIIAAIFHIEGAEAIGPDLDELEVLYQAGLRSLGPVWSRPNIFGYGVPFAFPASPDIGPGLTEAGKALVKACNRLRIMIDLSHLNEAGFWDVARLSDAPLVATHSNAHAICPSSRNLTDRQLDAIRDSGGMVGLNFGVTFLRPDGKRDATMPLSVMVQQISYLVERLGIDHVGFGSDFDGALIPKEIGDVRGLPRLLQALTDAGFTSAEIRKLAYENWLRVLRLTWGE